MGQQENLSEWQPETAVGHECCAVTDTTRAAVRGSLLGRALMAVGVSGAVLAALCCVAPFLLAGALAAVGLSFLLKEAILIPPVVFFFGVAVVGYSINRRK